ncbi:hypothetical protein O1M63_07835 [Streptomyces mirabilis]|nr:hypothetical protein [Streptomyces mirabilis]
MVADPRVVAAIVSAVHEQVPVYAALDDSRLPEVRAIAAWGLERLLHLWVTDGALEPSDLRRLRGIAAARAADGRPVQAVLRAYRVAATVLTDEIAARAPRLAAADAFALTRMLLTALDTLSEEMTTAYAATDEDLAADRDRALRLLLDDLIAGRHASVGALSDRSARLGSSSRTPTVCWWPSRWARSVPTWRSTRRRAARGVGRSGDEVVSSATVRGSRAVLLLPVRLPPGRGRCWARGPGGAVRSPGEPGPGRSGASARRRRPRHGARPRAPAGRVLTDADAHVLALLGGHPAAAPDQVARLVLGPLTDPGSGISWRR